MSLQEKLEKRGIEVGRREYGTHHELIADFGPSADVSVDVVGDTVIVVAGEETHDLTVDGSAQAFMKNGVLTIEVTQEAH